MWHVRLEARSGDDALVGLVQTPLRKLQLNLLKAEAPAANREQTKATVFMVGVRSCANAEFVSRAADAVVRGFYLFLLRSYA